MNEGMARRQQKHGRGELHRSEAALQARDAAESMAEAANDLANDLVGRRPPRLASAHATCSARITYFLRRRALRVAKLLEPLLLVAVGGEVREECEEGAAGDAYGLREGSGKAPDVRHRAVASRRSAMRWALSRLYLGCIWLYLGCISRQRRRVAWRRSHAPSCRARPAMRARGGNWA